MRGGRGKGGDKEREREREASSKRKNPCYCSKNKISTIGQMPVEMNSMNTHMKITITGMDKFYIRI